MKNFISTTLIIILSMICINQCSNNKSFKKNLKSNGLVLRDTVKFFTNSLNQTVAEKETYKGTAEQLETYLDIEKHKSKQFAEASKKWKKLYNAANFEIEFKVENVDIPFDTIINFKFKRNFFSETDTYAFKGTVNQFGINIDALAIATLTPMTGIKSVGLFSNENRTEITSSNKLIKVTDFSNFTFVEKKNKWGVGVSFGIGFYQKGFFVGPSVNYNIIQF
jgi:hypothetical protein